MVLVIGEILVDMIGKEENNVFLYERRAGGAPFNVASAINRLGGNSSFIGAVGNDLIGQFLLNYAQNMNFTYLDIAKLDDVNTTLAFVELDSHGERSFCFYRKNTADYKIAYPLKDFAKEANIVHVGSLMLSEKEGRDFIFKVINDAHKNNQLVSFDVNFRTDIFKDKDEAVNNYKKVIELADIVKFSEDEVDIFTKEYVDSLKYKLICVTLGSEGSLYKYNDLTNKVPSIKVNPVDTTGAGDAFFGALLYQLDGHNLKDLTKEFLDYAFRFANITGSLNTLGYGAIDNLPTKEKVLSLLNERK